MPAALVDHQSAAADTHVLVVMSIVGEQGGKDADEQWNTSIVSRTPLDAPTAQATSPLDRVGAAEVGLRQDCSLDGMQGKTVKVIFMQANAVNYRLQGEVSHSGTPSGPGPSEPQSPLKPTSFAGARLWAQDPVLARRACGERALVSVV